ncbi:G2/M phase-specific E3 ubiquitin-protein ligase-like [Paramisgurnus dabryanus]|uniref:G2/M phase-specific E3 ubiquitin-protein ligase-like n=1 Tax=Paramisgurnus dabryanus TaxID=90735 RepID=UPI0031F42A15
MDTDGDNGEFECFLDKVDKEDQKDTRQNSGNDEGGMEEAGLMDRDRFGKRQTRRRSIKISGAASLQEIHRCIDKYASLLQTAGCFEYPKSVEGKQDIVKDFVQWYIIYRNQYSIQRFRDGLSTLDVIYALEQHSFVFKPYVCCGVEKLTPESLEAIFKAQLSEVGSTRRQEETRILGYWRDYLLDTGEQETGLSLQDILMFATGLDSLPPLTMSLNPDYALRGPPTFPLPAPVPTQSNYQCLKVMKTSKMLWTLEYKTPLVLACTE